LDTCERLPQTDLREQCVNDAFNAYTEAMRKAPQK
jgi:hypothetical protein